MENKPDYTTFSREELIAEIEYLRDQLHRERQFTLELWSSKREVTNALIGQSAEVGRLNRELHPEIFN